MSVSTNMNSIDRALSSEFLPDPTKFIKNMNYNRAPLHFLLHSEMPNKHRAPIVAAIARTLMHGGHSVTLSCEPKIAFRFGNDSKIHVETNANYIDKHFGGDLKERIRIIEAYSGNTPESLHLSNELRRAGLSQIIKEIKPDHVIIWSGNFHYQVGTRAALHDCGIADRTLFAEVGWFSQKEYIYLDSKGVNAFSTLPGAPYPPLLPHQRVRYEQWLERYRTQRIGTLPPVSSPKRVFVPLQIDTDTSITESSPFKSMLMFIQFLETWIPHDYEVVLKLHPKATYPYVPTSSRPNFRFVVGGSIDQLLSSAETVLGINSTVLLEAAALGKRVIAFGQGVFSDTGALLEASIDSCAQELLRKNIDTSERDSFLYHLVYERQISLEELRICNYGYLVARQPFRELLNPVPHSKDTFIWYAKEGKSMIKIGKSKVARTACLDVERGGQIVIGDDCEIRHHAVLEVSGKYNGSIEVGNRCVIGIGNWLQGSGRIKIANDVIIGPYVAIVSTNHMYKDINIPIAQQPLETGEVIIEDDVWIGAHCTIAHNVRIGAHSIIGANSFVNKDVPPYSIVVGAPAKVIKSRK